MTARKRGFSPAVAVGLVTKGDLVLMVRRKRREGRLRWNFPGGSIERHENDAEAVVREVKEETGVDCIPERRLVVRRHPDSDAALTYWLCSWKSGEPRVKESSKADRAQWIRARDVLGLVTSDVAREILEELTRIDHGRVPPDGSQPPG